MGRNRDLRDGRGLRLLLLVSVMAALLTPAAMAASPRTTDGPFRTAETETPWCETSTCTAEAGAEADSSGNHTVFATIDQPQTVLTNESVEARATGWMSHRVDERVAGLRFTFRWRVDDAATAAESKVLGGIAVGRVFARGKVTGCSGCALEDATDGKGVTVASTYSRLGPAPPERVAILGSEVTHSVVLRGPGGGMLRRGTKLSLAGHTIAFGYVGGPCSGGGCETVPHSGWARASADLQLLSITVEPA